MKLIVQLTRIGVVITAVLLLATGGVRSEEKHSVTEPQMSGSVLSMARFYGGPAPSSRLGTFPGKLVCLRCDLHPGPGAMSQCEKEGHRHALSMDSDGMIHPLLAGTEAVLEQINSGELHGKEVSVHGQYYPATGAILVDRITATKQEPTP